MIILLRYPIIKIQNDSERLAYEVVKLLFLTHCLERVLLVGVLTL